MKKVYCKYCRYLEDTRDDGGDYFCKKIIKRDSALAPFATMILDIYKQNKNNDCKYYEYKKYEPVKL